MGKSRRLCLWLGFLLSAFGVFSTSAEAVEGHDIIVPAAERPVKIRMFTAPGNLPRPAVLLLHGAGQVDPRGDGFRRYTEALTSVGIDAYVVYYYNDADTVAMGSPDHAVRSKAFTDRVGAWAKLVSDVVTFVINRPETNGRVGVLGVSNGGTLGVGAATRDPRISALVACYGSFPPNMSFLRMPPTLILHGDADQVIPPVAGKDLADIVKKLGGFVQLVTYPGAGHGFDLVDSAAGIDARRRAVTFLSQLLSGR